MPGYVIYRISDRAVVSYSHPRDTPERTAAALAAKLQNVVDSEIGGVLADYASVEVPEIPRGQVATVAADLTVSWAEDPATVTRREEQAALRNSIRSKLQGAGLTRQEADFLLQRAG